MRNFFIALQELVNNEKDLFPLYYESAGKNVPFPYGVISDPVETLLKYGNQVYFDINIWCTNIGDELELKIEKLIEFLDTRLFKEQRAIIYFEGQKPVSDLEFELVKKKLTFSVRIF